MGVSNPGGRSREHGLVLLLALLAPLGLLAIGVALRPDPRGYGTHEQLGFRPCLPMRLWNVPCPGCGVTTAVALAMRGEARHSLRTQPFGLVTIAAALGGASWAVIGHVRGRDLYAELGRIRWKRWGALLLTLGLLAWAYKLALLRGWIRL